MVSFGNRKIGDGEPCFITFEAGPTHDGKACAQRLISHAAQAGADAIKFQIIDPDRLVADRTQLFTYDILVDRETGKTETVSEPLYDIFCRRALSPAEWKEVKAHSDALGLAFFATVGFDSEIQLLEELNCDSIKIASADVNHWPFIRKAARTGMCVQLDTGSATLGEIEAAVDIIQQEGNDNVIIHNCPSGYPARLDSINLNLLRTLKTLFPFPVAFSDHTPGWEMDIAAVALGANLVEKTITEDKTTPRVEHIFSLEPHETQEFIQKIRDLETAMGAARRILHPEEIKKRTALRRSAFLTGDMKKGQVLRDAVIDFRRPGYGLAPNEYEQLQDAIFRNDLPGGSMLKRSDLESAE